MPRGETAAEARKRIWGNGPPPQPPPLPRVEHEPPPETNATPAVEAPAAEPTAAVVPAVAVERPAPVAPGLGAPVVRDVAVATPAAAPPTPAAPTAPQEGAAQPQPSAPSPATAVAQEQQAPAASPVQEEQAPHPPPDPTPPGADGLAKQLSDQGSALAHHEARLAQLERGGKQANVGVGAGVPSVAAVAAFFGVGALLTATVVALDTVLVTWFSAAIVGVALIVVAAVAALIGR